MGQGHPLPGRGVVAFRGRQTGRRLDELLSPVFSQRGDGGDGIFLWTRFQQTLPGTKAVWSVRRPCRRIWTNLRVSSMARESRGAVPVNVSPAVQDIARWMMGRPTRGRTVRLSLRRLCGTSPDTSRRYLARDVVYLLGKAGGGQPPRCKRPTTGHHGAHDDPNVPGWATERRGKLAEGRDPKPEIFRIQSGRPAGAAPSAQADGPEGLETIHKSPDCDANGGRGRPEHPYEMVSDGGVSLHVILPAGQGRAQADRPMQPRFGNQ